jgi:hypothetical protein
MMEVVLYINGRIVGSADAQNIGGPEEACEYQVFGSSGPSPVTGGPGIRADFKIEGHNRVQSAWALAAKIAEEMAKRENDSAVPAP